MDMLSKNLKGIGIVPHSSVLPRSHRGYIEDYQVPIQNPQTMIYERESSPNVEVDALEANLEDFDQVHMSETEEVDDTPENPIVDDDEAFANLMSALHPPSYGDDDDGHNDNRFFRMDAEARIPIFEGATTSRLSATLLILNLQSTYGVPNVHTDALFKLLSRHLLPKGNDLPKSHDEAKKVLKDIGMEYEIIHCCPKGCVLYRKELAEATECPLCKKLRYRKDTIGQKIPEKVMRYFPLIPRLKHIYGREKLAKLMTWHSRNKSTDGSMRYVHDSKAWKHVDETWPEFGAEPRNVRLGLAMDGVNPYKLFKSKHSTWPILFINYNIPPWLAIKKGHVMLSTIIPGPKACKDPNPFMAPMKEECYVLWVEGVKVFDSSQALVYEAEFQMKVMILWTMHDWPGLGSCSGLKTSGYRCCYKCGDDMEGRRAAHLRKIVYHEGRRRLPHNHAMRRDTRHWPERERRLKPIGPTVEEWRAKYEDVENGLISGQDAGIHRWSILFELPYWKRLLIRWLLDPMHIEVNVTKSVIKHLYGTKDSNKSREDCEVAQVHEDAWMYTEANGTRKRGFASWIIPSEQRKKMNDIISTVRFPTGYGAKYRSSCSSRSATRPNQLKSHDYHKMMQHVLPVVLRACVTSDATKHLRQAIYDLSALFRWVCSREIKLSEIEEMKLKADELLCTLEKVLPPSFFDIQVHLVCHLVEEVEICGPVHARWMYWVERYMKVLKGYVRQKAEAEGSMARGHLHYEALFYCSESLPLFDKNAPVAWEEGQGLDMTSLQLKGAKKVVALNGVMHKQVHNYVLQNDPRMEGFVTEYRTMEAAWISENRQRNTFPRFLPWVQERVGRIVQQSGYDAIDKAIHAILRGPYAKALSYTRLVDRGRHFRIRSLDRNRKATSNSGLFCAAIVGDGEDLVPFTGVLDYILEVEFGCFKQVLLGAKWYKVVAQQGRQGATLIKDQCGFYRVNTTAIRSSNLPDSDVWAYPSQVDQCYFIPMLGDLRHWSIVIPVLPRGHRKVLMDIVEDDIVEDNDSQDDHRNNPSTSNGNED